jgi:CYTH domain-containing protein
MYLTESEYNKLEYFKGREIRKNRYFLQYNNRQIAIDIFLGELWGLNIGLVEFENEEDCSMFEKPEFSVSEVTNNKFFTGETLVGKTFADVQKEFTRKSKKAK